MAKILRNPSGMLVDVPEERASELLAGGFQEPKEADLEAERKRRAEMAELVQSAQVADLTARLEQAERDLELTRRNLQEAQQAKVQSDQQATEAQAKAAALLSANEALAAERAHLQDQADLAQKQVAELEALTRALAQERDVLKADLEAARAAQAKLNRLTLEALKALDGVSDKGAKAVLKLLEG